MPLARHDAFGGGKRRKLKRFLLTCLLRGMTACVRICVEVLVISTHMPLARHDTYPKQPILQIVISTHMPLARHDFKRLTEINKSQFLLTCLLRGMTTPERNTVLPGQFLLTCLLRGMTSIPRLAFTRKHFYSHASCEA